MTERLVKSIARSFASPTHPAEDLAQELRLKALAVGDSAILPIALRRHAIDLVTGHRQWTGHKPVRGHREPLSGPTATFEPRLPSKLGIEAEGTSYPVELSDSSGDAYLHLRPDVRAAVRSLPHTDRLYIWHRFYEDQTNAVAAQRAGVHKSRWDHIRVVLAERLTPVGIGVTLQ